MRQAVPMSSAERSSVLWPGPAERAIRDGQGSTGKLLSWLLRYPLQRVRDLVQVLGVSHSTASRLLRQVETLGLVERVRPACLREDLYYLSETGRRRAADLEGLGEGEHAGLASAYLAQLASLLVRFPTLITLQNTIYGLVAGIARRIRRPGDRRRIGWHWVRDYRCDFRAHERPCRLSSDALLVSHLPGAGQGTQHEALDWYGVFLFVDAGLVGAHDETVIARRITRLLRYRECEERTAVYDQFPPALILADSRRQAAWWHRMATLAADRLHLSPLAGAVAVIAPGESECDPWLLAWQRLGSAAPCRLEDLFVPLPRAALPPGALPQPTPTPADERPGPHRTAYLVGRAERTRPTPNAHPLPSLVSRLSAGRTERAALVRASLHLGRRHHQILRLLYAAPLLSVPELAALLDLAEESVLRYLRDLLTYPLVEGYATASGERFLLGSLGLRWMAASLSVSLLHLAAPVSTEDLPYRGARVRLRADLALPRGAVVPAGATGIILAADARTIRMRMVRLPTGTISPPLMLSWHGHGTTPAISALLRDAEIEARQMPPIYVPRAARALRRQLLRQPQACRHLAGIYGFLAWLHRAARERDHRIGWWETGNRASRRYHFEQRWHNLRPDAALSYETKARRLVLWLEWDCGTMSREAVETKFEAYATYALSRQFRADGERSLPWVLIVAPTTTRERWLSSVAMAALGETGLVAATTTAARMDGAGPLAPIWWRCTVDPAVRERRGLLALAGQARDEEGGR
jgi:DNA-binding MarR family transcriptional regulator